jgi:hypothetical protein
MAKAVNKKQETELKKNQFAYGDNTYEVVMPKVNIPGIGTLTAAEIAVEEAAQAYLVNNGCIGSVLKQIFN